MEHVVLKGSLWALFLFDVSEEIDLDELRRILGTQRGGREPSFHHSAPEYVRFQEPPVVEPAGSATLASGTRLEVRINHYQYGVVSVAMEIPFEASWKDLVQFASRWIGSAELEQEAEAVLRRHIERIRPALVHPYASRLSEDYALIHLRQIPGDGGGHVKAAELIAAHGLEIAQVVRGECVPLSEEEVREILQSRLSYYPDDLLVVGWAAAFLYDSPEGAAPAMQLLEYANTQLLEFRRYDEMLTEVLAGVYPTAGKRRSFLFRWRLAREAERLNAIRLDLEELTERMDNSIKFLSDMFFARVYRLAAVKIGVPDYRKLVDDKLQTAAALYHSMMEQFHRSSAFVLELMVVIILIIDLIFLLRSEL
ncbi:MAG TPA: hypothetical protein VNN17_01925 [Terriglobia bacterium]|nr:hypothetical protein [Terriglobia bacterium]